jgi:hypothetical protein
MSYDFFVTVNPRIDCFFAGFAVTLVSVGSYGLRGLSVPDFESIVVLLVATFVVATLASYFYLCGELKKK